ncbi:threonine--tRNA ligase [Candidatus Woesearchaeota archaeon]|nr:threonine--tRNA ligase [Candidatus Woesearchaeota archaeon]
MDPKQEKTRHSAAHILAYAIQELYPDAKNTIGPPVEEGFYYDFENLNITPADFPKIESKMKEIIKANYSFKKKTATLPEIKKIFKENKYKIEMAEEFKKQKEKLTIYSCGKFSDLCRGPHVKSTGQIKAIKLTKIAGAYWRGDVKNKQLTRLYGIAFETEKEMKTHLQLLEEASKRDHRKIGKNLELFSFHEEAPGMPFWHAKGTIIWNELLKYWREEHKKDGYEEIRTPVILNKKLWLLSGHWEHYKENMYFTKVDEQDYALKPMNCPGGILVYKNRVRSYKELPLRMAEIGLVHRHELSGVLAGLLRVRAFNQDDAHIYCIQETLKQELKKVIQLSDRIYKKFGFQYNVELSTKPEKAMGDPKLWEKAEKELAAALDELKMKYKINPGDGAFYGPKIDFHLKDALGRTWQCGTLQLDFQMPIKFNLKYMGEDGTQNHQPITLHRTIYGSIERFIGILLEHTGGKLPLWISPIQVRILTVADRFNEYAEKIIKQMDEQGIRAELDGRTESIGKKVREAQLQKINYILVVGERELSEGTVTIRTVDNKIQGAKKIDTFIKQVVKEITERK